MSDRMSDGRHIMSDSAAHFLLENRGIQRDLDAFVVAACFDRAGTTLAIALGDGTLRLVEIADRETWRTVEAHDGAILSLANVEPERCVSAFGGDVVAQGALVQPHLAAHENFPRGLKEMVAARSGTSTACRVA